MITVQTPVQRDRAEEELMAWLTAKSSQEFRQFLAGSWTASLFSPEAIEQLYQKLQQQEEEAALEVGQD